VGETGICEGDSGGPALDAAGKVVGVVSRGSGSCETPVYTAVSQWRAWILEIAAQAVVAGGYPAPFWVTTGLSDPPGSGTGGTSGGTATGGGPAASGGAPPLPGVGGSSGGGGVAGNAPESPAGQRCDGSTPCPSGFACYWATDPAAAVCTERCETGCGPGLTCNAKLGVCTSPPSDDGGCSLGRPSPALASGSAGAWLALTALALGRRRRRFALN
jgi:hypothetical protein